MKKLQIATIIILLFCLAACKKSLNHCVECDSNTEMIFQTSFNNTTLSYNSKRSKDSFSGTDTAFNTNNDWLLLQENPSVGYCEISYEDGEKSQRYAEICNDPTGGDNQVLKFKIIEPHIREGNHKKGRVQVNLNENQCIKEFYQTVRLYLHPDMAFLKEWEERVHWLSIFEFWNNANFAGERNPFRVSVSLFKIDEGPVDNMYFAVVGDRDILLGGWDAIWAEINENVPIQFGVWMTIELYLKEGDENYGRFYMSVQPDGEEKTILFDITNYTQHPRENYPDGYTHINPLKLYTSDKLIEYMSANGKNLEIYWDDWTFWRNKNPF